MSWTYQQSTGIVRDRHGAIAGIGYSGFGAYQNLPSAQTLVNQGPIPRGFWDIIGPPEKTLEHGRYVLRLQPYQDTKTFNRDDFLIHGDGVRGPGTASSGCIVVPCIVRKEIWESDDHTLQVIA
jgi:Protein of unknown function (DUF2778)